MRERLTMIHWNDLQYKWNIVSLHRTFSMLNTNCYADISHIWYIRLIEKRNTEKHLKMRMIQNKKLCHQPQNTAYFSLVRMRIYHLGRISDVTHGKVEVMSVRYHLQYPQPWLQPWPFGLRLLVVRKKCVTGTQKRNHPYRHTPISWKRPYQNVDPCNNFRRFASKGISQCF